MADNDLTPAELQVLTKTLSPEQLQSVWGKFTDSERAELRKISPTYVPPAPATSEGALAEGGRYLKELVTGEGTARGDVADYLKREVEGAAKMPGQLFNAIRHPIVTAEGIQAAADKFKSQPLTQTAVDFVSSPEAVGGALASEALPEVAGIAKGGVNRVGTALATNPKVQAAADLASGTIAGVMGAKSLGLSPFIGGILGRNLFKGSSAPKVIGEAIEGATGGRRAVGEMPGVPGFSRYGVADSGGVPPVADAPTTPRVPYGGAPPVVDVPEGTPGLPTLEELKRSPQVKGMTPEEIQELYTKMQGGGGRVVAPSAMRIPAPVASHAPAPEPPIAPVASHPQAPAAGVDPRVLRVQNEIMDRQALHQPQPVQGVPTKRPDLYQTDPERMMEISRARAQQPPPPPAPPQVPPNGVLPENLAKVNVEPTPGTASDKTLMETLGGGVQRPEQIDVSRIPASKSKRTPRAVTPQILDEQGMKSPLTKNDIQALVDAGMPAKMAAMPITRLPPEAINIIRKARAIRAGDYKLAAELDAIAKRQGGE